MTRAVLDTNVVVGGHISSHGRPAEVLDAFYERRFVWVVSELLIREVADVLRRPEILRYSRMSGEEIADFVNLLWIETDIVPGLYRTNGASADPRDDPFLACAIEGNADVLVSEDKSHLLALKHYRLVDRVIQVVDADGFLEMISAEED